MVATSASASSGLAVEGTGRSARVTGLITRWDEPFFNERKGRLIAHGRHSILGLDDNPHRPLYLDHERDYGLISVAKIRNANAGAVFEFDLPSGEIGEALRAYADRGGDVSMGYNVRQSHVRQTAHGPVQWQTAISLSELSLAPGGGIMPHARAMSERALLRTETDAIIARVEQGQAEEKRHREDGKAAQRATVVAILQKYAPLTRSPGVVL